MKEEVRSNKHQKRLLKYWTELVQELRNEALAPLLRENRRLRARVVELEAQREQCAIDRSGYGVSPEQRQEIVEAYIKRDIAFGARYKHFMNLGMGRYDILRQPPMTAEDLDYWYSVGLSSEASAGQAQVPERTRERSCP